MKDDKEQTDLTQQGDEKPQPPNDSYETETGSPQDITSAESDGSNETTIESEKRFLWLKYHHHVYGWGSLLLAIFVFFIPNWSNLVGDGPDAEKLNSKLELRIQRQGEIFTKLEKVVPLASADQIQVAGRFEEPTFAQLIWIDQLGQATLIADSGKEKTSTLQFPASKRNWATVDQVEGSEMILLIATDKPVEGILKVLNEITASNRVPSSDNSQRLIPKFNEALCIWITPAATEIVGDDSITRAVKGTTYAASDVVTLADQIRDKLREEVLDFRGVLFPHQ